MNAQYMCVSFPIVIFFVHDAEHQYKKKHSERRTERYLFLIFAIHVNDFGNVPCEKSFRIMNYTKA